MSDGMRIALHWALLLGGLLALGLDYLLGMWLGPSWPLGVIAAMAGLGIVFAVIEVRRGRRGRDL